VALGALLWHEHWGGATRANVGTCAERSEAWTDARSGIGERRSTGRSTRRAARSSAR
jgi:hypothetical protein